MKEFVLELKKSEEDEYVDLGAGQCVAWKPGTEERERSLAYSGSESQLNVWRVLNPDLWMLYFHERIGFGVTPAFCAWSPCGRVLAATLWSYKDKTTLFYDRGDQLIKLISFYKGHRVAEGDKFIKLAWNRSGKMLATCANHEICVWKLDLDKLILSPQVDYSDDKLIMAEHCGALPRGYVPKGGCLWYVNTIDDFELLGYMQETHGSKEVNYVQWHPKKDLLFSCGCDGNVKLWVEQYQDGKSNWQCSQIMEYEYTIWSLAFNANGNKMVTCSDDGSLQIWATENAELEEFEHWIKMHTLARCHDGPIFSVHWSSEGFIATGAAAGMIGIFVQNDENEVEGTYRLLLMKKCHGEKVNSVQWSPGEDSLLASASSDETIKLWALEEVGSNDPSI